VALGVGLAASCAFDLAAPVDPVTGAAGSGAMSSGGGGATSSTTSSTGTGGVAEGGAGGNGAGGVAGSGGVPELPCDARFSFSANPATAGVPFDATFTDDPAHTWVHLEVTGPGAPDIGDVSVGGGGGGPYTWTWTITGHGVGVLDLTFLKDIDNPPGTPVGYCQLYSNP
jgi:hypothetical protein